MAKVSKILVSVFLAQLFLANVAAAATSPQYLAPENSYVYLEFNTAEEHPFKGKIQSLWEEHLTESDNPEAWKVLSPYLESTTLGYSQSFHQTDGSDIHFLSLAIPQDAFDKFLAALPDVTTTNLSMNRFIYLMDEDFYFSYLNGNLIASSKEGLISDLLMQSNPDTISNNTDYQFFLSKISADSFFKTFINFANLPEDQNLTGTNWLKSEGIALNQTLNGLEGTILVAPTEAYNMSSFSFVPELYQQINPKNLLFYSETFNLRGHGAETLKLLNNEDMDLTDVIDEMSMSLEEETGLNWETDLSLLFEQRSAWLFHSEFDQQYYPAFTLISEVHNREGLAKQVLTTIKDKLITSLNEAFEEAYQAELAYRENYNEFYGTDSDVQLAPLPPKEELRSRFYRTTTVAMPDGNFEQIVIDPNAQRNFDADSTPEDAKALFSISMRVTSGGQMIVTTLSDPKKVFSTPGLASDADWQKSFNRESVLEIYYLHFPNLKSYILALAEKFEAPTEFTEGVEKFLSPFTTWYGKTTTDQGYILSKFKIGLDMTKVDNLIEFLESIGTSFTSSFDRMEEDYYDYAENLPGLEFLENHFTDVDSNAWYAKDVFNLDYYDIMNGYGDQFKPNQHITRAEFVKTLMTANENYRGIYYTAMEPQEYFTDVASGTWYAPYINKARAHKIVEGYLDNTFHPDSPITRAEAVKIIAESAPDLFGMNSPMEMHKLLGENHPFYDVLPTDWFYNSVYGAYWAKVVTGKTATSFAPHDLLTRAETAALINRFMNL